jgi:aminopeptidase N
LGKKQPAVFNMLLILLKTYVSLKKIIASFVGFVAIVLLVLPLMISAQELNSRKPLPPVNSMRTLKIDVKHIVIDLQFDWKKKQAYGTTTIVATPVSPIDTLRLDAGMLTIQSVSLTDGTSLPFIYDGGDKNDGLQILLHRTYLPTEDITVKIKYNTNYVNEIDPNNLSGSNGKGLRFSQPTFNDPIKPKEIWSAGEIECNRYWCPCYDAPNDWRSTELIATVENNLTVISNGNLLEKKDLGNGTCSFHYKMEKPYANHQTSLVVGEYLDIEQRHGNTPLHSYGYRHEKGSIEATIVRLPDMVKYFSEVTGSAYPYSSYSQVFVQDLPNWVGNSTNSNITENMVDDEATHADFFYLWDLTEAEALAHQWFAANMGCRDWGDSWLNKAFPRYFNGLYQEYKNGKDEFLSFILAYDHGAYLADWNSGNRHPIVTKNYENGLLFATDNYAYGRGAEVLHMLRKHLGEETWRRAIQLYVKTNAGKSVTSADFIKAVNQVSPEPMDWFFEQWLYKMGHPVFELTKEYDEVKKRLTIRVRQIQKADSASSYPQTEYFKGKVDIAIDGKITQVLIEPKLENVYSFFVSQRPELVNFDYESTWIKELIFEKTLTELLYQLAYDKDVLGKQWALNEIAKRIGGGDISAGDTEKIKTVLRNTLRSNAYWRVKLGILSQLRALLAAGPNNSVILDKETKELLLSLIKNEKSWLKATLIGFLGATKDPAYTSLYLSALNDKSDRVIAAAASALGKTKSAKAFPALAKLVNKPSMKSQSLLSALAGLKELDDERGFDIAYKALTNVNLLRWRLPTGSVWDYRVVAAGNIAALNRGEAAFPIIFERFTKSLEEDDISGMFNNALLVSKLADPRGQELFDALKSRFKNDANAMTAVLGYEAQFHKAIKKQ